MTKVCSKCGVEKDVSEFHKSNVSKDGYKSQCKECRNKENRNRRKYNACEYNEKQNKKRAENVEYYREYYREYYNNNKDKIRKNSKEYVNRYYVNNYSLIRERSRKRDRIGRATLCDEYVIKVIKMQTGLKIIQITRELIELKRVELTAKRELRNHKKSSYDEIDI